MIFKFYLIILSIAGFTVSLNAQGKDKPVPVKFRAVLHDPVHPTASLFYPSETGEIVPLKFRPKALTRTLLTLPANGSLVLYDKAEIDPENPAASLVASVKLAPNFRQAIVVVVASPTDQQPAYRLLVIDDSKQAFPGGESRVLPLIGVNTAIQAGEHRLSVRSGEITRVPPVRKVNAYNMAQTNFYYQQGESWLAFTERQLQYLDVTRRLFIVHTTPGAMAPTVTTIVDTAPAGMPR